MPDLTDIAHFRSDKFTPILPEDSQVNPGVYGAELAFWLCTVLAQAGIGTTYPESEDWGWFFEYHTERGSEFAIHCGNVSGYKNRWMLSLRRFGRKMFGRDKPPFAEISIVTDAIKQCLESETTVTDLEWHFPESQT